MKSIQETHQSALSQERSSRFPKVGQRPSRVPAEGSGDYVRLTPTGYHHPIKADILSRFRMDLALPESLTDMASFTDIWVDQLLAPVSLEPFSPEEETAVQTGNFASSQRKQQPRTGAPPGTSPIHGGARVKAGRAFGERDLSHSLDNPSMMRCTLSETESPDQDPPAEEVLWNMPQDHNALGSFDEKGNFSMASPLASTPKKFNSQHYDAQSSAIPGHDRLPPPGSTSSLAGGFFGGAKGNDALPSTLSLPSAVPLPVSSKGGPPDALALVTVDTKWLYRDPSGQVQGPFPGRKMLHWYMRKYFPESLPLRREQDILFEPLSLWKIKCGGVCPFEIGADQTSPPLPPVPVLSPLLTRTPPLESAPPVESTSLPTASILAKLGLPWSGSTKPAAVPPKAFDVTTGSQGTASGEKTPSIAPSTSKSQPAAPPASNVSLAAEQLQFLQKLASPKLAPPSTQTIAAAPQSNGPSAPAWKKLDMDFKAIDFSRSSSEAPKTATEPLRAAAPRVAAVSPENMTPASTPSVGWSKPAVNSKPLSEILREEAAEAEAARRAKAASASTNYTPRSFADTLRSADSIKSPIVPPTRSLIAEARSPTSISSAGTAGGAAPQELPTLKSDVKAWILSQLKPLESSYDIKVCAILLMELKSPTEITSFVEDNIRGAKMDMQAFARELIQRRFGEAASAESESPEKETSDFVTVSRRIRKTNK